MLKLKTALLLSTALIWWQPGEAHADPVTAVVSVMGLTGTAAAVATFALNIGLSMGLSWVANKLTGSGATPRVEQQKMQLQIPTSLPPYRFVYGETEAVGTPIKWAINGDTLCVCYLLNSRASHGEFIVWMDRANALLTGDLYNLAGDGATSTHARYNENGALVRMWVGLGGQASAPAGIVSASGGAFASTDACRGSTVLWAVYRAGDQSKWGERWKAAPPEISVRGKWSLVWNPASGVTEYNDNQALCLLDALINNPIRPYPLTSLWLDTWRWASTEAGTLVPTLAGNRKRYRASGTLVFADNAELEGQLEPLIQCGGSRLIWSGGQVGIIPAVARSSVNTITDLLDDDGLEYQRYGAGDDVYTEGVARYPSRMRSYETTETPLYVSPGAQSADGGLPKRLVLDLDFCSDDSQAQRLIKIAVERSRCQRRIAATLPPEHIDLVSGSRVTIGLPPPYTALAGEYEIDSIHPAADLVGESGVALRLPAVLTEYRAAVYAWALADEVALDAGDYEPAIPAVGVPTSRSAISGGTVALISGYNIVPRIRYRWSPPASGVPVAYEWQYQLGGGEWISGGTLDAVSGQTVYTVYIAPVQLDAVYGLRVRAMSRRTSSDWSAISTVTASGPALVLGLPEILSALPATDAIDLSLRQTGDNANRIDIAVTSVNSSASAEPLLTINAASNVTASAQVVGQSSGTKYVWARARDAYGNFSAWTASVAVIIP